MRLNRWGLAVKASVCFLAVSLLAACEPDPADTLEVYLHGEGSEAARASLELIEGGEAALDVLLPAYADPSTRRRTELLLVQMGEASARRLVDLLMGEDDQLATAAAETLTLIGAPAVTALYPYLEPTNDYLADVVFTMARLGDPAWQPLIDTYARFDEANLRRLISAALFLHGNESLARRLLHTLGPTELGDDLLSSVALNLDPAELAELAGAELAQRILTFTPLEPMTLEVSGFNEALPRETRRRLAEQAERLSSREPLQSRLLLMHLAAAEGDWLACADYGTEPFGTLIKHLEESRDDPPRAALYARALLHHGSIYLHYLIRGAESGHLGLAAVAEEVARRLRPLVGE